MMKKWHFVLGLILTSVLVLTACGGDTGEEEGTGELPETDEVVVGVYGGNWEEQIVEAGLQQFEEDTGIEVIVNAGADANWFSSIKSAGGENAQYDVLIFQPDTIERAIAGDLLEPLDPEYVPNVENIYDSVNERFTMDGDVYAAGFSMGQLGIAYRTDLVPFEPENWMDLWDERFEGQVGVSSPSYSAGLQFFSGVMNAIGGEESSEANIDATFEKLSELQSNTVAYPDNPGTIQTLLERGEISAIPFWDGRVFALQDAGLDIGFTYPEDGPVAALASWVIPKGAPNLANAYELVNHLSSPEVQGAFAELSYYGMTNENVEYSESLSERVQVGEEFYQDLTWVDYEALTPKLNDITERWTNTFDGGQ
ncbi:ABC transporter substrate-binding protein [Gracilibacillus sp. YIM 98692]|uniref:ABC transporter substrate-binding protein n=1 Tax=Gracilibacillus sp. YIM 98692 TaxID=2663532 RepID=UPI001969CB39|nr:ABC transporter substrate-binding protein [Gracilibacillus sp. YIM 98692]